MRNIEIKIREIRRRKKITLDTLAQWSGLTKGYLSKLERGLKSPPISTLSKLADALGVEIAEFFKSDSPPVQCAVVTREQRRAITRDGVSFGYSYESIAYPKANRHMEPFVITLVPTEKETPIMSHQGEEMIYVLKGKLEFLYRQERYVLREGDCVYFDSGEPHRAKALDGKEAKALSVILSPRKVKKAGGEPRTASPGRKGGVKP
ncbi:MAG: cupin domain-containing protein [Thermodesulfobacteriota bacterium]